MAEAVALARLTDAGRVDEALGLAAMAGRFGPGDLNSILDARRHEPPPGQWRPLAAARHPSVGTVRAMSATAQASIDELTTLCRRLRLRYIREQAPDVLATAKAQRWDPAEVLRVLLVAEAEGRDRATIENKRKKARFPAGKTFDAWDPARSSIPDPVQQGTPRCPTSSPLSPVTPRASHRHARLTEPKTSPHEHRDHHPRRLQQRTGHPRRCQARGLGTSPQVSSGRRLHLHRDHARLRTSNKEEDGGGLR
jgi:hypothetical protein